MNIEELNEVLETMAKLKPGARVLVRFTGADNREIARKDIDSITFDLSEEPSTILMSVTNLRRSGSE